MQFEPRRRETIIIIIIIINSLKSKKRNAAVDDITESQSVLVILSRLIGEASTLGEEVGEDDGDGEETEGDDESVEVDHE